MYTATIHCTPPLSGDPILLTVGSIDKVCDPCQRSLKQPNSKHRNRRCALHDRYNPQKRTHPCDTVFPKMSTKRATAGWWISIFRSLWINESGLFEVYPIISWHQKLSQKLVGRSSSLSHYVLTVLQGSFERRLAQPKVEPPKSKMTPRSREWTTRKISPWNPRLNRQIDM